MYLLNELQGQWVVVRAARPGAGTWFGKLKLWEGTSILLEQARQAWSWTGPGSAVGLATSGPTGGKITEVCALTVVNGVFTVHLCTPTAVAAWNRCPGWVRG